MGNDKPGSGRSVEELLSVGRDLGDIDLGEPSVAVIDDLLEGGGFGQLIPDEAGHAVEGDHLLRVAVDHHGVAIDFHLEGAVDPGETG